MLKNQLLFIALLFSIVISNAQAPDSVGKQSRFIKSFRVNVNYNHYNDFYNYSGFNYQYKNSTVQIGNIGLGYTLKSRKNFNSHDIELSNSGFHTYKNISDNQEKYSSNTQDITLRYQYNYFFIKRSNLLFSPYLGASCLLSFSRYRSITESSVSYHNSHRLDINLADQFALVPGIQYRLSSRVYLDLSIPINILRGSFSQSSDKEYPQFNSLEKYADQFSFFKKDYYQIRMGVGIIINPENRRKEADRKYIKTFKVNFYQRNYIYKNFNNLGTGLADFAPVITFQNAVTRNMHEVELSEVKGEFEKNNKNYSISARYQFDYFFIKKPSRFAPYLGVSGLFNYNRYSYINYYSSSNLGPPVIYYQHTAFFNYTFGVVPGFQYHPCNKFYLDFSFPVNIWNGALGYWRTDNPSNIQSNSSGVYGDYAKRYHNWDLRIGVGFKL
jgi:outer membrane protein W